jgi:hypothetical protein
MRRAVLGLVALLAAAPAGAQTTVSPVYNPALIEFDSPDHAQVTTYRIETLVAGADPEVVMGSCTVLASSVEVLPAPTPPDPQRYRIRLTETDCPVVPMGSMYVWRVSADSSPSQPSNIGRYSICEGPDGSITPMTITVESYYGVVAGQVATLRLNVQSPKPVHVVTIDLTTDGRPAFYYHAPEADLRGGRDYLFIPHRALSSRVSIEATDELGCRTTVSPLVLTVTSGG